MAEMFFLLAHVIKENLIVIVKVIVFHDPGV